MLEPPSTSILVAFLEMHPNTKYVHYNWTDLCGRLCERVVPKAHCISMALRGSPMRVGCFCLIGFCSLEASELFGPAGCDALYPDWSSLRLLELEHASVLCAVSMPYLVLKTPQDPFARCPRKSLQRVLSHASTEHGLFVRAGFEIEFYLLNRSEYDGFPKSQRSKFGHLNGAQSLRGLQGRCVEACVTRLQTAEIYVQQFHGEAGAYQMEISLAPMLALAAADSVIQAMEIIRRTATTFDLWACFLPRPFVDVSPSGLHMNLSLHSKQSDEPTSNDSFAAGILQRLPALCAISMPIPESYQRRGTMLSGNWVAWGSDNRDVPLRKAADHWEVRTMDATANVYLSMAAYIAAGIAGIKVASPLTLGDSQGFLEDREHEGMQKLGVQTRMPAGVDKSWEEFRRLADDESFVNFFGRENFEFYSIVHQGSLRTLAEMPEEEMRKMYLELF